MILANKYRAKKTTIDGITFDSKKEGARYLELKVLERIGEISGLELQPKYAFELCDVKICTYRADFKYTTLQGEEIIEDVKGFKTAVYNIKKKMMKAFYGIEVLET